MLRAPRCCVVPSLGHFIKQVLGNLQGSTSWPSAVDFRLAIDSCCFYVDPSLAMIVHIIWSYVVILIHKHSVLSNVALHFEPKKDLTSITLGNFRWIYKPFHDYIALNLSWLLNQKNFYYVTVWSQILHALLIQGFMISQDPIWNIKSQVLLRIEDHSAWPKMN